MQANDPPLPVDQIENVMSDMIRPLALLVP
jgi:hypothetical protein